MHTTLATLINRLDSLPASSTDVISWGAPVPVFGDLAQSRVATLGLNPSNREFVDDNGNELDGQSRRFHTLRSLNLPSWSDVDARHLRLIVESCDNYFAGNPYDRWFRILDAVLAGAGASYYNPLFQACHLDLIPYATMRKWAELSSRERASLLALAGDTLALLLRDSPVEILILNGQSVVDQFESFAGYALEKRPVSSWTLLRSSKPNVTGFAYSGVVQRLCGVDVGRNIRVLGYNHNLQSSFGVTTTVVQAIRKWIEQSTGGAC